MSSSVQARLTAWAHYSFLMGKCKDSEKALKEALKRAFEMDPREDIDRRKEFARWNEHDLWPPPELEDTTYGTTRCSSMSWTHSELLLQSPDLRDDPAGRTLFTIRGNFRHRD